MLPAYVCTCGVCFVCVSQVMSVHVCVYMCECARVLKLVYTCVKSCILTCLCMLVWLLVYVPASQCEWVCVCVPACMARGD